uniref:Inosine/uridine-preferring nucleoside hydrolase domain-containing protein n=1 Tax=viral metagenome TaxID=1070528 RepID=A0A6C0CAN3_9ZZZZ
MNENNNICPHQWFYYADSNGDDLQMVIREIKDPLFIPIGYVGSKFGFTTGSLIFRRFLALLNVRNIPVQDGYNETVSSDENFQQGIASSPIPIQFLGDTLWGGDVLLPSPENAVPLSKYPSHILLRKAIFRALRTGKKFSIRLSGPATDLARDLEANKDLDISNAIHEIRISGGAINVPGNLFTVPTNTVAEFNVYLDPQAFVNVLSAATHHNIHVNMIPLDATDYCPIDRSYFNSSLQESTFITTEGKSIGLFFENVKAAFGDAVFFNDANIPGGGFYQWDAYTSRLDETYDWKKSFYNVETTPLIATSGKIYQTSPEKGYPIRVGFKYDCSLFRKRWKPIFDKPYFGDGNHIASIECEKISFQC